MVKVFQRGNHSFGCLEAAGSAGLASSSVFTFKHRKSVWGKNVALNSEQLGCEWKRGIKIQYVYVILRPLHIWPAGMMDILKASRHFRLNPACFLDMIQFFWPWRDEHRTQKCSKSVITEALSTHSGRLATTGMAKYQRLLHPCEIFRKLTVKLHLNMS